MVLVTLYVVPALLLPQWIYYLYSPFTVGLWFLSLLAGPAVACAVNREWIRTGRA
ncbi:hypothetical protein ACIA8O_03755 [Kitasatospora sp. NPDC051853]|uniref:hypothetical protein n=1 Tax=Kitasatospora sp. NPDC051853 TaxID=3364058 RepID=UPI00378CCD8A